MSSTDVPDPADRIKAVREHLAREGKKLRSVDSDGRPTTGPTVTDLSHVDTSSRAYGTPEHPHEQVDTQPGGDAA